MTPAGSHLLTHTFEHLEQTVTETATETAPSQETAIPTTAVIRAWAQEKDLEVGQRGRLSAEVVAAYHAAHAG